MPDYATRLGASKSAATLIVLYVPSKDRADQPIDQGKTPAGAPTVPPPAAGGAPKPTSQVEPKLSDDDRLKCMEELKKLTAQLATMQGEHPLILPSVDAQAVSAVVADWTGTDPQRTDVWGGEARQRPHDCNCDSSHQRKRCLRWCGSGWRLSHT